MECKLRPSHDVVLTRKSGNGEVPRHGLQTAWKRTLSGMSVQAAGDIPEKVGREVGPGRASPRAGRRRVHRDQIEIEL